jgi:spore germination protein (amino acid permease)
MLSREDYKMGTRETVSLILIIIGAKFTDMTPSLMFDETEMASWMALILSGGFFLITYLIFLNVMKKYPDKGLIEVFKLLFGNVMGFWLGMILFLIVLCGVIADARTNVGIISTLYFPETSLLLLFFMLMAVCTFIAKRGLEAIGRTSVLFIVWIKAILLLLVLMIWKKLNFSFLFPLLGREPERILTTGFKFMPIFAEIMLLSVFMYFFKSHHEFKKDTLIGFAITSFELLGFWLFYIMTYDVPIIKEVTYMFHETTRIISVGRFLTNPETVFLPVWLIAIFIRFAFYIYLITAMFAYLFNIHEFEPLLIIMAAIVMICGLIPDNAIQVEYGLREHIVFEYGSFYFFFFPFLMWIAQKRKEKKV